MAVRVLHLVHWLNRGGIESWLLDLIRATDRSDVAMDIVCRGPHTGELVPLFEQAGASVHLLTMGWNPSSFGGRLKQLIREQQYEVLHVHGGSFVGYPCKIAKQAGAAAVCTFHSTKFIIETGSIPSFLAKAREFYTRRSFKLACQQSDRIVAVSQAVMDSVIQIAGVTPDNRFKVLLLGTSMSASVDPAVRAAVRSELAMTAFTPVAIHAGTMRDPKNHAGLLRIANLIRRQIPDFRLILAGDGPLRPKIESQISNLKLENTVTLLGVRSDVERLLEASDIMIFPSLWEGFGIAALEAQIKGLPVVGSDIPALHESTAPMQRDLLFPVRQEQQMADAAVALLRDPQRRRTLGEAVSQYAAERFSIKSNAQRHLELYRSITTSASSITSSSA